MADGDTGVALISGLGGDAGFGEQFLARNDDGSTMEVDITSIFESGVNFFGREFTTLWVNNNGSVTFNGARSTFTPTAITEDSGNPEISPFFADVDTRGGAVEATPGGNSMGTNLVYYDFDMVNDRFIVTWDDVGYYSSATNKLNAFQLILSDRGDGDFDIEFRYEEIDWTTGNASGGTDGLGGTVARAGYTAGTGSPDAYFELPASGDQAAILALDETEGNTGDVGRWLFNVRSGDIVSADIPPLPDRGATGWTSGDPHLSTLDGFDYDFHAAGEFVLSRGIGDAGFEIQGRFTPVSDDLTVIEAVAMRVGDAVVMIDGADAQPVLIDGVATEIENFGSVAVGAGRIYREDDSYTVVYSGRDGIVNAGDSRMMVDVRDGRVDVAVRANAELVGDVEGLLGNADADPDNDVALADGTVLARPLAYDDLYGAYRDDWRVTSEAQSLFTYDTGESVESFYQAEIPGATLTIADFDAAEVDAAEQAARDAGLIEGTTRFDNAVLDLLVTSDDSYIDSAAEAPTSGTVNFEGVVLSGTDGDDVLEGTEFDDIMRGRDGADVLRGEADDDFLYGGDGTDTINGGDGNDTILGGDTEADRRDQIFGGAGDDRINAGYGNDAVFGQGGNDIIAGGFGADELQGQDGNDTITGSALSDLVFGGEGDDFVNGGFGFDRVNGGAGADSFYHLGIADHGSDWIQDYSAAEGDVLLFGDATASADDFNVQFTHTSSPETGRSGDDDVQEAFVVYRPAGLIVWALVDGGGEASLNVEIGGEVFDLLA
ncbi:Ca2+-binding RTX toxin-like protein [Rhodovulum iodosum]|uniref:Ca2+-binding RTX toxin-like protein n=1 Tax=Rhodovulum iodosum TaxID=68291 RepID=A0ABV3XT08_9RHOB